MKLHIDIHLHDHRGSDPQNTEVLTLLRRLDERTNAMSIQSDRLVAEINETKTVQAETKILIEYVITRLNQMTAAELERDELLVQIDALSTELSDSTDALATAAANLPDPPPPPPPPTP